MRKRVSRAYRSVVGMGRSSDSKRLVIALGGVMILAQLLFRAWALYPSWFYLDDYNLLIDAKRHPDVGFVLTPYNSHLMPGGRLLALLVESSGQLNWGLASTITLILQGLAGCAALWMLVTLFGSRWAVLAPLSLYLFSPMNVPAMMWWTASLNQVPLQGAFFAAVGAWVVYLRTRRTPWLVATTCAVVVGLLFYVKALLIFPVLVFLAVAYFSSGSPRVRLTSVVRRYWPAAVVGAVAFAGYLAYYMTNVRQPFEGTGTTFLGQISQTMLGTAFMTGVLGGPWQWAALAPPNSFAAPPISAVNASWVVVALVLVYGLLRRQRTLRAWVLLAGYLVGLLVLLVSSRAPAYGSIIGLEYRYLTDAACAVMLCLGLAFLPLLGAEECSSQRADPLLRVRVPTVAVTGLVAAVLVSGVLTSVRYVNIWHTQNASDAYMHNLAADLRSHGSVDLADGVVPDAVVPSIFAPDNNLRRFVPLVAGRVTFPDLSPRLAVVGADGGLRRALIQPGVVSKPGPKESCGWPVDDSGLRIPLTGKAFNWTWWVRVGYVATDDSPVTLRAGSSDVHTSVDQGPNNLYVKVNGSFQSLRIDGLDPGVRLCVDTVEVGQPVAGGLLP